MTATPRARWLRAAAIAGILGMLATAAPGAAQDPSPGGKAPTVLEVTFLQSSKQGIPHYIIGRLSLPDGSAVSGVPVKFSRTADVFGGRKVTLGTSKTDGGGVARIAVVPREEVYHLTVSFAGTDAYDAAKVEQDLAFPPETVISGARPPHGGGLVNPHLSPLADVMPGVIGSVVLVVWVVLFVVALGALLRIRRTRREDGPLATPTSHGDAGAL